MSIEDPTFGCGAFLPGVGPGNFPDFDGGGTIDGGGGDDWTGGQIDGVDPAGPPTRKPNKPGDGGGDGGGGPGGPGQPTGGPPGPGTGGPGGRCRCRITGSPTVTSFPTTGPNQGTGQRRRRFFVRWEQECKAFPYSAGPNPEPTNASVMLEYLDAIEAEAEAEGNEIETVDDNFNDSLNQGCKENGACGGECDDIFLVYDLLTDIGEDEGEAVGDCYCVYPAEPTSVQESSSQQNPNCTNFTARFIGECKILFDPPPDTVGAFASEKAAGSTGGVTVETGTTTGTSCGNSAPACGGACPDKIVSWRECGSGATTVVDNPQADPITGSTGLTTGDYTESTTLKTGETIDFPDAPVYGCTDSKANNYDENATIDDGSCEYDVFGCTDAEANNYNPNANIDDGSCWYGEVTKVLDPQTPTIETDLSEPTFTDDFGNSTEDPGGFTIKYYGCTDPNALNYDPRAQVDDGSCEYPPSPLQSKERRPGGPSGFEFCPPGQFWSPDAQACVDATGGGDPTECPPGYTYNPTTEQCERDDTGGGGGGGTFGDPAYGPATIEIGSNAQDRSILPVVYPEDPTILVGNLFRFYNANNEIINPTQNGVPYTAPTDSFYNNITSTGEIEFPSVPGDFDTFNGGAPVRIDIQYFKLDTGEFIDISIDISIIIPFTAPGGT